jgi:hypothetical protein
MHLSCFGQGTSSGEEINDLVDLGSYVFQGFRKRKKYC